MDTQGRKIKKFKDGGEIARILWEVDRAQERERDGKRREGWRESEGHLRGWWAINKANEMAVL